MLTGGRSASQLYKAWAKSIAGLQQENNMHLYFGDERCVPPSHTESNHRIVMSDLFPNGIPAGIELHRMEVEGTDLEAVSDAYSELLPDALDVLLLSVGEDGHIASLFPPLPDSAVSDEHFTLHATTDVFDVHDRLTLTLNVIGSASEHILILKGDKKRRVFEEMMESDEDEQRWPLKRIVDSSKQVTVLMF